MKATGEVMAIDRTFGAALNKALRGLEQAGAGPLAEDPAWRPTFDYLAGGLRGRAGERATSAIRWIDERGRGVRVDPLRPARRGARSSCAGSSSRPTRRLWRLLGLLRRGVPGGRVRRGDRHLAWFLAEMGRNVGLEARAERGRAAPRRRDRCRRRELLATAKRAGVRRPRARRRWPGHDGRRDPRTRDDAGPRARATRWSTPAPRSSRPRRRTSTRPTPPPARRPRRRRSRRPAALVIGSARCASGRGSSSTTAPSRPPTRCAARAGRR